MFDYKTLFNNYSVQNKWGNPVYNTTVVEHNNHPAFVSTVSAHDYVFESHPRFSKKEAERCAASKACENFKLSKSSIPYLPAFVPKPGVPVYFIKLKTINSGCPADLATAAKITEQMVRAGIIGVKMYYTRTDDLVETCNAVAQRTAPYQVCVEEYRYTDDDALNMLIRVVNSVAYVLDATAWRVYMFSDEFTSNYLDRPPKKRTTFPSEAHLLTIKNINGKVRPMQFADAAEIVAACRSKNLFGRRSFLAPGNSFLNREYDEKMDAQTYVTPIQYYTDGELNTIRHILVFALNVCTSTAWRVFFVSGKTDLLARPDKE